MGKKGRKTRWRKLPIPIGNQGGGGGGGGGEEADEDREPQERSQPNGHHHPRVTFNEDEYTRITTPRQDMLFKKGYLSKKRATTPSSLQPQDTADTQSAQSADSVESEQYICEEPMQHYVYNPPAGYIDQYGGVCFLNSNAYEVYDPYTGNVTVIVGPPAYVGGQPVLAAVPCQPVPLQPVEWFNPAPPQTSPQPRKNPSSTDSQNCSGQSSESTCPPSSPQEPVEPDSPGIIYPPQYGIYPGYMFGAPVYNMNGVSVQGVVHPNALPADIKQRRKKRRRRRRGGVTDEGSESSCEEQASLEAGAESQSGASSDTGPGSSSSKTNSDSGIHMEPNPNSGEDQVEQFSSPTEEAERPSLSRSSSTEDLPRGEEPPPDPPERRQEAAVPPREEEAGEGEEAEEEAGRRRREAIERAASALAEEAVRLGVEESARRQWRRLPITEAVTRWLESQGGAALSPRDADDDDPLSLSTGQKNADGNPFPVLSLSGAGIRVADDCLSVVSSGVEWDVYGPDGCRRLGAEGADPLLIKTSVHFHRSGPFPCGVCCLIQ